MARAPSRRSTGARRGGARSGRDDGESPRPSVPTSGPRSAALAAACLLWAAGTSTPGRAAAQEGASHTFRTPSGPSLTLPGDSVRQMLERTRRLAEILEEDPDVLYYLGTGPEVSADAPGPAYPWRAVTVQNDSVARVEVPANYREARRAYYNYAVRKMEAVRSTSPATSCSTAVEREVGLVSAFVEGWIVTRTLYGGPAFAPLDAFVFARREGHLPALLVALGNTALGGCVDRWKRDHPQAMEAYRRWRDGFEGDGAAPAEAAGPGPAGDAPTDDAPPPPPPDTATGGA